MADGVTDTSSWEELAGVASTLLGAASHRKRASTSANPVMNQVHLHRRSSSLVSDLTIDGITDGEECCFKCPRVLERFCCSPDALGSPTATSLLQPPSTPSTCGAQPAALQHQPDNNRAAALPPSPVLKAPASSQRLQLLQQPQSWQQQPPRLARRSCPGALGMKSLRSSAVAAGVAGLGVFGMHPPASPGMLRSSPTTHSCGSPAAAAAGAAMPTLQLNSLMLVASQLSGSGNGSSSAAAGAPGDSTSPLLPATQACLKATTASVVAAELTAAAVAGQAAAASEAAGSQRLAAAAAAATDAAAAAAAEADDCQRQQQPKQLELPSWLRSGSAGLAASAAICRASLLSTTAALARLSQQQPAAIGNAQQPEQQQQMQACQLGAQPAAATACAAVPLPCSVALPQAGVQGVGGPVAVGIPVSGGVVMGMPVDLQQQQQQHEAAAAGRCGTTGRLLDFKAAGACAAGQLCMSSLRLPTLACLEQQRMEQGSMQCDDASSCCSTPRSGAAAAGAVPSEDVRQVADAAARLLLSSSSGSRRRRFCWEAEAMDEEQCRDAVESDGESAEITSAAARATAATAEKGGFGLQAACVQQLASAVGDAAACAVVVVVDVAAKRSSGSSKESQQLVTSAASGLVGPAVSAGCCGESP